MARLLDVGSVMFHPVGCNPYVYAKADYAGLATPHDRREFIAAFRAGKLPEGWAAWNDRDHEPLTDPDDVQW